MSNMQYEISVILPVYNEEENIEFVLKDTTDFLQSKKTFSDYEIIVVDDGSRDGTDSILRRFAGNHRLKIISHPKNLGYGQTIISGLENSHFSLVFFMDADGQFSIRELEKLILYINQFDIVVGYRKRRVDPMPRVFLGQAYTLLFSLLFGLRLKDLNCGFKLFKRQILDGARLKCTGAIIDGEILLKSNYDRRIKEIGVTHFPRLKGRQSGASPKVIFQALCDLCLLLYEVKFRKR